MAYSASLAYQAREMAGCVDKILKGAKPAELTIAQPTKFELVIILKIAKALGLIVPPTLPRADKVIEQDLSCRICSRQKSAHTGRLARCSESAGFWGTPDIKSMKSSRQLVTHSCVSIQARVLSQECP
jgi:hypothetical protein